MIAFVLNSPLRSRWRSNMLALVATADVMPANRIVLAPTGFADRALEAV